MVCKMVKVSSALGVPDVLNLEPMSSMFVIGSPSKLNPKAASAAPTLVAEQIRQTLLSQSPNVDLDNVNVLYSKNVPVAPTSTSTVGPSSPRAQTPAQQNPAAQLFTSRSATTLGY